MLKADVHIPDLVLKSQHQVIGVLELRAARPLIIKNISLSIDNQSLRNIEFQGPMQLSELTVWEIPFVLEKNRPSSGKSFFPQLLGTGKPVNPEIGKMIMESQLEIVAKVVVEGEAEELVFRQTVELW